MHRVKEIFNAITMIPPSLMVLQLLFSNEALDIWMWIIAIGTWTHLPFAVSFHLFSSHNPDGKHTSRAEKLDQTFVHISHVFYAYGITKCRTWTWINFILNFYMIMRLWCSPDWRRSRSGRIILCCAVNIAAMILAGNFANAVAFTIWFIAAGLTYRFCVVGVWSHSLFHLLLCGVQYHLFHAAASPKAVPNLIGEPLIHSMALISE